MPHIITINQALSSAGVVVDEENVRAANTALNLLSAKFTQMTGLSLDRLNNRSEYFFLSSSIVDIDSFGYARLFLDNGFIDSTATFEVRLGSSKESADSNVELDLTLYSVDYEQGLLAVNVSDISFYNVSRRLRHNPIEKFMVKVIYSSGFVTQQYEIEPNLKPKIYVGIPDWVTDIAVTLMGSMLKPCGKDSRSSDLEILMWSLLERAARYHPLYHKSSVA